MYIRIAPSRQLWWVCLAALLATACIASAASDGAGPPIEWVRIPACVYNMGSTPEEIDAAYQEARLRSSLLERYTFELEGPSHAVSLDAFEISRYEITNEQYRAFTEATDHRDPRGMSEEPIWDDPNFNGDAMPVVGISWYEARAFAIWVGADLPTEAQWERAARGVDRRKYPWGDRSPTPRHANHGRRLNHTAEVGSYERGATPEGIHDLGGNAWEWCLDADDPGFYAVSPKQNPVRHADEPLSDRVIRGGSWDQGVVFMRGALRFRYHPHGTHNTIGFRVARAVVEP